MASHTHESPVSDEKVLGLGVEGNVRARTLGIVVGTGKLCTGGRKSPASDDGIGQSGASSGSSDHLVQLDRGQLRIEGFRRAYLGLEEVEERLEAGWFKERVA
jgi:hypothetical protein